MTQLALGMKINNVKEGGIGKSIK